MLFNIDEKQLMLELKNKDERALKICMNKYYRYVVYIVENIIGSALPYEDKEEVVSNVFVALWNYSADLDTDNYSTFKPYLGTIARNMAKNALRKTSKMHFENYEDAFQVGTNEHIEYGPLKEEVIGDGFDMVIMRELTGGLYFGERHTEEIDGVRTAVDTLSYNENEIRRIAIKAFDIARKRKKHVISVDKANVLDSSRLWRAVVEEVAKDYEDVTYEHMLVDNCAMQLVNNPRQFDVILTENMFGDILSDEASMITGSIGMLSSASLAEGKFGLYEPSHGSAPDIAGQDIANPIATILSAAMMLRYSFDLDKEADEIEKAVKAVLADGYRTVDIMSDGMKKVGCKEMGQLIIDQIK